MSQKTSQSQKKASAKGTGFAIQLTRKELFLWLAAAFAAMVWMFTLGVIVGRGVSPVQFDVEKLKKDLIALNQETLKREEARYKIGGPILSKNTDLDFYERLTEKKEQARLRSASKLEQQRPEAKAEEEASRKPEAKTIPRVDVNQKEGQRLKGSSAKKGSSQGSFTLQVLALKDSQRAKEMVSYLKSKGFEAYEVTVHVPEKGTYHRVRVGHFKDRHEASQVAARLRYEKLEPIIVRE